MGESYEQRYRGDRRDSASGRSTPSAPRRDDDADLHGGTGEVGTDEGYRVANDDEDYRYTPDRGWGDQRADYGNAKTPSDFPRAGDARSPELGDAAVPTSTGGYGGPRARGEFAGRGARGYARSDEHIHANIVDRMKQHPELYASDIAVVVTNGEVVLQGHVPDRASKHLADDIADSVGGVTTVHNQLRVASRDVGRDTHH